MADCNSKRCPATTTRELTVERLRELLRYDQETGFFQRASGSLIAVKPTAAGYIRFELDGKARYAQRLAVLYMTGAFPLSHEEVDHINGVKSDNRWVNLRVVSVSVNQQNRYAARSDNQTGLLGVSHCGGKYVAQIWLNQKKKLIGYFNTAEEAHAAYLRVKREMHAGGMI